LGRFRAIFKPPTSDVWELTVLPTGVIVIAKEANNDRWPV
jgi:hypothetical protein